MRVKEGFIKHYFKPQKPVVIESFIEDWSAYHKCINLKLRVVLLIRSPLHIPNATPNHDIISNL